LSMILASSESPNGTNGFCAVAGFSACTRFVVPRNVIMCSWFFTITL
jgi:hypothetical protein